MIAIVAVENNWGIGKDGKLLASIPEDMRWFKMMTINKTIVMGRTTLESFPDGKPLPKRKNIVMSHSEEYHPEGVTVVHNLDELGYELRDTPSDEIFLVGGSSMYIQYIDYCDTLFLTRINDRIKSDRFFPKLGDNWVIEDRLTQYVSVSGYSVVIEKWVNKSPILIPHMTNDPNGAVPIRDEDNHIGHYIFDEINLPKSGN